MILVAIDPVTKKFKMSATVFNSCYHRDPRISILIAIGPGLPRRPFATLSHSTIVTQITNVT